MGLNSYNLNETGDATCCICRKKFFVSQLETCCYCDRFVCRAHSKRSKRISGGYVCSRCKASGTE